MIGRITGTLLGIEQQTALVDVGGVGYEIECLLIAEVSQFFTLKIGDVIFTGTPAGVATVAENDILEGYLEGEKAFKVKIK